MEKTTRYRNILALGAIALGLGIVHSVLFFDQAIGLNFSLFAPFAVCGGLLLAHAFGRNIKREQIVLILLAFFFSSMVYVRSGELLTFYNVLGTALLLFLAANSIAGKSVLTYFPSDYLKIIFLPIRFIKPYFKTLLEIFSLHGVMRTHPLAKEIIRGTFMAIIALTLFAWLFSSADAVFAKLIADIFSFKFDEEFAGRLFVGAIVASFFIGAFGFMYNTLHPSPAPRPEEGPRTLGAVETMILLGSLNALFLFFILLQLSNLFGGESHVLATGLTYAEYARKGFFELVFVAIFAFLIISFAELQIVKSAESHLRSFKLLSTALVLQVICVLVSAFARLSLYEDAYGFTDTRLYSHALMIWIAVVLVLLSRHIWTNGARTVFALRIFSSAVLFLFIMNILNPDVFIVKKNLERYAESGRLDAQYLARLSDDALPYTIQLLNDPREDIRGEFARWLYWKNFYNYEAGIMPDTPQHPWQSSRLGSARADKLLTENKALLEQYQVPPLGISQ